MIFVIVAPPRIAGVPEKTVIDGNKGFIGPPRPGSQLAEQRDAPTAPAEAAEVPAAPASAEAAEVPAAPASAEEARIPDAMCESISSADDASPPARKQSTTFWQPSCKPSTDLT